MQFLQTKDKSKPQTHKLVDLLVS